MAESFGAKYPQRIAGSPISGEGQVDTGQVLHTYGGTKRFANYSGTAGGDANIHVGGGRLDYLILHPPATAAAGPAASGLTMTFYDAAAAVSGGPLSTSGHTILWQGKAFDANAQASTIWNSGLGMVGRVIGPLGVPFHSGLCHTGASGHHGFTALYTPAVSG